MFTTRGRTQLVLGVLLILMGAWFIMDRTIPDFHDLFSRYLDWPYTLVAIGAGILLLGLVLGSPGLAVPAAIVAGIGGIFIYQELNDDYESWSYVWTLIPGFVGVGSILAGLLGDNTRHNIRRGLNLMVISAVLFLILSSLLGDWRLIGNFGPAILMILLGLWVLGSSLVQSVRDRRSQSAPRAQPKAEPDAEPKKEGE